MRVLDFIQHFFSANTKTSQQPPFIQEFYQKVLRGKNSKIGGEIEDLRKKLCKSNTLISFQDFGAKGTTDLTPKRTTIRKIARSSARKRYEGEFLYRLCEHYQPKRCLELGTNLGISTLYQAIPLRESQFITLEGALPLLQIAKTHFDEFKVKVETLEGEFSDSLKRLDLESLKPDYVFIDGNHRYEATIEYFEEIRPFVEDGGIMFFDDIYWSEGMKEAWKEISSHKDVSISIDLFFFGLCFIRNSLPKQHYKFRII